ncbi:MAG: TolC family protein, partial [Cytophagales bacterium]|nr:TolC family protein [Cytophagales bacterium]
TQSNRFPTDLQNQEVQFNPNNFYDAKFRVAMPLFNTDLIYNRKIKQATIGIQEAQVTVYKRELVKDIQVAYFNYLKASQAVDIYTNALALVQENKRINQRLVTNGSASPSVISRSNAEIAKIETGISESVTNQKNAAAYFNFLINKPLDSPIQVDSSLYSNLLQPLVVENSTAQREEKLQYKKALEANKYVNLLSTSNYLPKLNAFIDLGSQAFDFKFNYQSRYYLAGLSLDWPIFSGFRNIYKSKQTEMDLAIVQSQAADVDKKLELQLQTSTQSYISAKEVYQNNLPQVEAAKKYLDDVLKRYKEGQAIFIEVLDARTEYTNAQLQLSVALFNVYSKKAELDRASASYQF